MFLSNSELMIFNLLQILGARELGEVDIQYDITSDIQNYRTTERRS